MSYLKALEPLMHGCVQVLEDVLEDRCAAGGGTATVNIYDLLSSLASVSTLNFYTRLEIIDRSRTSWLNALLEAPLALFARATIR